MMHFFRIANKTMLVFIFSLACISNSFASPLTGPKNAGQIGEMSTGYLGSPNGHSAANIKSLIDTVNQKRKQHYQKIAQKNKISLLSVEKQAGIRNINKTPAGQWVHQGSWKKK